MVENFYMELPDDGCVAFFVETLVASIDLIYPLLSKAKVEETIQREKSVKAKGKKRCCHEEH